MNHDYAHCLDYDKTLCPETCFRAELARDLEKRRMEFVGVPLTYSNLKNTEECKRNMKTDIRATLEELYVWNFREAKRLREVRPEDKYAIGKANGACEAIGAALLQLIGGKEMYRLWEKLAEDGEETEI